MEDQPLIQAPEDGDIVDLVQIEECLRRIGVAEALMKRVASWASAKRAALAATIDWNKRQIEPFALAYRQQTGLSELPLVGGTVKVRRASVRTVRDDEKLAAWAAEKGLAGEPYQEVRWKFAAILEALRWSDPDEDGVSVPVDPATGEVVDGATRIRDAEFSVSVKAKELEVLPYGPHGDDMGLSEDLAGQAE